MSKLIDFEDTQAAIFLLRLSFGIVRATHFMRTTPLCLWSKQAEEFDEKVSQTVFQCLGLTSPQNLPHSRCPSPRPTRVLPRALFASKPWTPWGITPYAARSPATEL